MSNRLKGALVVCLMSLVGTVFGLSAIGTALDSNIGLLWLFKIRGEIEPPSDVVVVGINGRTPERLNLPRLPRDWPRTIHVDLIDSLIKRGAAAVVFDIHFFQPKKPEDDAEFAESVKDSNRAILFEKLDGKRQPVTDQTGKNIGWVWAETTVPPMESLANAARGLGPFPLPKIDAELNQFWVFKASAADAPTLPSVALQFYRLPVYEELLEALKEVDAKRFAGLPDSSAEITNAEQLRSMMVRLRRIFSQDPNLEEQLYAVIESRASQSKVDATSLQLKSLIKMYAGEENRFINLYGPPGTIKNIPYASAIAGSDPNLSDSDFDFTDKVVFVGYSDMLDPGQPDRFYTVFTRDDGVDLSGVEIMATAFGNLLDDSALKPTGAMESGAIMFAFGVFIGLIAYLLPAMIGVPLAILVAVSYTALTHYVFGAYTIWLPAATPLLIQFPLATFFGLFGQYFIERRRVKQMSEMIGQYLPEDVVQILTGSDPDENKINRVVYSTCLATDMAGFSTMAEKIGPGELAELLNDYFDSLASPLKNNFVDVTEFRADAIMCAWTAETPEKNVRRNALQASLEASDAFGEFKRRNPIYEGGLRIGLEAGMVHVGHSGGGGKFVYSIVGDCANTASRVEGLNKQIGTHVLATETVIEGVEDFFVRDVGRFQFVGKTEGLRVFEVMSTMQEASDAQKDLRDKFSEAIKVYQSADWRAAQKSFETILAAYPKDGPTQFYWQQCQGYLDGESVPEEPDIIQMTKK
ncbi:MAG: adenylate/guanylate cyclase domain-containing protein [Gammaproteobacteria bacterium]